MWFGRVFTPRPLHPAAASAAGRPGEALCAPPLCRLAQLPDTGHWHPLHARASGLLLLLRAAACQAAALLLPSPPAACSTCRRHMRGALLRTYTDNWVGGWVEISCARRFRPWASALMVGLVDRRLLSSGSLRAVLVGAVECGMSAADGVEGAACRLLVGAKTELLRLRPPPSQPARGDRATPSVAAPAGRTSPPARGPGGPVPPFGRR